MKKKLLLKVVRSRVPLLSHYHLQTVAWGLSRPPLDHLHENYSSLDLTESPNNLNSNMGQHTNRAPIVASQPDKLKEKVPFGILHKFFIAAHIIC